MGSPSISLYGSGPDDGTNGLNWRYWTVSTALVGLVHVGLLTTLATMRPSSMPPTPPPAMAIDLAPLPPPPAPPQPAPKVEPPQPPTPPQPAETRPKPRTPPPRQTVKPQPAKPSATPIAPLSHTADVAPAPQEMEAKPPEPAASPPPPAVTSPPTSAPPSNAARQSSIASWQRGLLQHLQSRKHYPRVAQSRRQEGIAVIRFVLDRQGSLLSARLERSSGFEILDEEAVDLLHRAQPLPPPPPEVTSDRIELTIPIEFLLK